MLITIIECNALTLSDAGLCSNKFRMSRNCPGTSSLHGCWSLLTIPWGDEGGAGFGLGASAAHKHSYLCCRVHSPDNLPTLCAAHEGFRKPLVQSQTSSESIRITGFPCCEVDNLLQIFHQVPSEAREPVKTGISSFRTFFVTALAAFRKISRIL